MYSRILSLKDYKEVALTIPAFVLDEARLEEEMQRLANPYIQWEEGNTAVAGDIVICDMASENTRFSKKQVKFVVGSGMFQREVEALVEGMKVGEQRETVTEGGSIAVTLRAVKTRYVPPLKDSMVEHLGLEGIYTLRDYRDYLLGVQKKKALDVIRYLLCFHGDTPGVCKLYLYQYRNYCHCRFRLPDDPRRTDARYRHQRLQ